MTDLFLSYKAEDRGRIIPLVQALEADGLTVWWDERISGGDQWREAILRELESARAVLVVWSKRSVGPQGIFVRDEATRAQRRETYVPLLIDKVEPPLGFGETQAIDLHGWKGARDDPRYQALLAVLMARLDRSGADTHQSAPRSLRVSRRSLIAGGAVAAAATGFGAWRLLRPVGLEGRSIAVLPFANLSADATQAYFSDGMAEELRSVLSRIPGLRVVARTSSEAVRNADVQAAASKLRVSDILTGSVRRSAQMIRVGVQLVEGKSGTEIWSEVYDRPFGDTLQIQSDIATTVAQALSIHLAASEERALNEGGTQNAAAQDLLLQAQTIVWRNDDPSSLRRALDLVDRAIALDPQYADAVAAKASILDWLGSFYARGAEDSANKRNASEKFARNAVTMAPRSAVARTALASALWTSLRLDDGLAEFERAAKLAGGVTSFFNGIDPYALALVCCRRFERALERCEHLVATDPLNPNAMLTKGVVLIHSRRWQDAYDAMIQASELGPGLRWPRAFQGFCLMQAGKLDDARKVFDAIPGTGPWLSFSAVLALRQGRQADADRVVKVMRSDMGDAGYFQYAEVFAQQRNNDAAIAALEKGWDGRDPGLAFINVDALLDPVRPDPRFQQIVKRLNFPPS